MEEHQVVRVFRDAISQEGVSVVKGEAGTIVSVLAPCVYAVELDRATPEVVTLREEALWPADWPEWDSPEWKAMMAEQSGRAREWRETNGFDTCPKCGTMHTCKTLCCRECSHKAAPVPPRAG
jgi:hypothetical protein